MGTSNLWVKNVCVPVFFIHKNVNRLFVTVVDKILDELLEEISDQIKAAGLDPLPIPDIELPFAMDNVK